MSERIRDIARAWAARHDAIFEWREAAGAWSLSTRAINGDDDRITIRPTEHGCELEKISSATDHVEVLRLDPAQLTVELDEILTWFSNRKQYASYGHGHEK